MNQAPMKFGTTFISSIKILLLVSLLFLLGIFDRNLFGYMYIYINQYLIIILVLMSSILLYFMTKIWKTIFFLIIIAFGAIESNYSLSHFEEKGSQNTGLANRGDSILASREDVSVLKNWEKLIGIPVIVDSGNVIMFGRICKNNYKKDKFKAIQKYYGISMRLILICTQNTFTNNDKGAIFAVEDIKKFYRVIDVRSDLFGLIRKSNL